MERKLYLSAQPDVPSRSAEAVNRLKALLQREGAAYATRKSYATALKRTAPVDRP